MIPQDFEDINSPRYRTLRSPLTDIRVANKIRRDIAGERTKQHAALRQDKTPTPKKETAQ